MRLHLRISPGLPAEGDNVPPHCARGHREWPRWRSFAAEAPVREAKQPGSKLMNPSLMGWEQAGSSLR